MTYVFPRDIYIQEAQSSGHSQEFIDATLSYAEKLTSRGLAVIFSRKHLANYLGIPYYDLTKMIDSTYRHYGTFRLRKKRGGYREIRSPDNHLKAVQRWILDVILKPVQPHPASIGFKTGDSIIDNAALHVGKTALLKTDLFRFFDTISAKQVYAVFRSLGYHKNLAVDLAKLCTVDITYSDLENIYEDVACPQNYICNNTVLPQGAPTSPALANLVARKLDSRLSALVQKLDVSYSRYADDLTFSGPLESLPSLGIISKIVREEGFYLNYCKTVYRKAGQQMKVTGLIVSGDIPRVPKAYKRDVRKHLYFASRLGPEEHLRNIGSTKSSFRDWLLGRIIFIRSVEPEVGNAFLEQFNSISWPLYE